MNFDLDDNQQMLRDTFARFLDSESSMARVRAAAAAGGIDRALWRGLAELGTFLIRVPAEAGGLGLGLFDAAIVMEEVGRTLATGPIAETILAARVLASFHHGSDALDPLLAGTSIATLAQDDLAVAGVQWLAGGAAADLVVARDGDAIVAIAIDDGARRGGPTLASDGACAVDLAAGRRTVLGTGDAALAAFGAVLEERKLLIAAALAGLAREAQRLAADYARDRQAFGVPIGTFQALSHPLADLVTAAEGGKYFVWRTIHDVATGRADAAAHIPLALWWTVTTAMRTGTQALRTFGGYGLTTEYDIHLYTLRAKAFALILGDPERLLEAAGERLYGGARSPLPDVGPIGIDFDLGEDARALASEVEALFADVLTPELQAHAHHSWDGHHPYVHKRLAEAGLLYPSWPAGKGGRGATPYAQYAALDVWERHGWSNHAAATTQMVAAIVARFGSEKAVRDVVDPVLAGDIICSVGYSEPAAGSDVFAAQTRATRDGDGWRIDGTKMFTSGANLSSFVLMLCRTNPNVAKHKGLTMFIVPLGAPGVSIQPVHTFQEERTNITFYDSVLIPDAYRLGEIDAGLKVMSYSLELEHSSGFAASQFTMIRAAEALCREIERDGRPLIEDRGARARLARAWARSLVSEVLGLRALWAAERKRDVPAAGPMAKLFSSEMFVLDSGDLLDLTAPASLSGGEGPAAIVNLAYRYAHATTIWAGTSEIHRSMIAERVLGMPRSRG